ncbi:hypothetical protein [Colwellia sp. UCD-KL20]|uniref:hypothetical protein n=1 Tax=Colwellia sp. UCD-KL20 TaxID=1917165 RepID=UPI000970F68C|nr:hypothetical protein [Colwellia sp. UCD-KL20]
MKHRLDFAYLTVLPNNIIEVVVDDGIELTLEMVEESYRILKKSMTDCFALLINNIHEFEVTFEAKLTMASHEHLKAIAFVYYNQNNKVEIENLIELRKVDKWNVKVFSGLEMGWQEAHSWLTHEMESLKVKSN